MSLIDDTKTAPTPEEAARRTFLKFVGSGALSLAGLGMTAASLNFVEPQVLLEEEKRFVLGRPEDVTVGTVLVLAKQKIFVVRDATGLFAFSAVCTHLGCITRYERESRAIFCPCHGSRYDLEGRVTAGPAPQALRRFALSVEKGRLVVDAAKVVGPEVRLAVAA